jgi:CheY-like chemotaxis protein
MMGKWLKRNCCDVTTASNGKLGLKCLREEQFDVCFMDFYMVIFRTIFYFDRCVLLFASNYSLYIPIYASTAFAKVPIYTFFLYFICSEVSCRLNFCSNTFFLGY